MKTINAVGAALVAVLLLTGALAAKQPGAQQPPPKAAPSAAQDEFVPVDSPVAPEDAMPAPRLVAIAYGFIWLVFFGYLVSLKTRLSKVERELVALSRSTGPVPAGVRNAKDGRS